ncbi:hypothetical protein A1O3_06834 [Capronia epimyces CBS 606.96]|uniref:CFEM domain-containing protein n=1 Tax=Capronia epimyces CBS 606.96 TaxID=1182542 RepID=W9XR49_9EURO|nr:uncharacterized protein A1O3_06834 [Capronia epimyces CBS 606.96]EXJ83017.1 hypothetical protein A1O3_06834 [Capronia epimyces CBS 606.96]
MHGTGLALSLLLSALALASPQVSTGTLSGLPACAQDAASAALGSAGCPLTDTSCICGSTAFINAITNTITQSCSAADVSAAIEFGRTICGPSLAAGSGTTSSASQESSPATTAATSTPTGTDTDNDSYAASTTTVPVTLTSMTSIPDSSPTLSVSTSTPPTNNTTAILTSVCSATLTATTTGSGTSPVAYTGAAVAVNGKSGQGFVAALMAVAGAVAWL